MSLFLSKKMTKIWKAEKKKLALIIEAWNFFETFDVFLSMKFQGKWMLRVEKWISLAKFWTNTYAKLLRELYESESEPQPSDLKEFVKVGFHDTKMWNNPRGTKIERSVVKFLFK